MLQVFGVISSPIYIYHGEQSHYYQLTAVTVQLAAPLSSPNKFLWSGRWVILSVKAHPAGCLLIDGLVSTSRRHRHSYQTTLIWISLVALLELNALTPFLPDNETEYVSGEVQQKVTTWRTTNPAADRSDKDDITSSPHSKDESVVLVTSLIDKAPNLGGAVTSWFIT